MRNYLKKITVLASAGCLLLSGCSHTYTGVPGIIYDYLEEVAESQEEYEEADIWSWPDTDEHEESYDWDDDDYQVADSDAEPGTVTIYVYMNGSNLETESGFATEDILEMLDAGYSENVNVLIQTMGTKYWSKKLGIKSDRSQTYHVGEDGLELVRDNLGQLDCTIPETLRDFIRYGAQEYPASRNILILWDHGGGPAYGFGWDEFQDDWENLSVDEMVKALNGCGVHFDFIGMDACIMSCLEVAYPLRNYCDYMILSEDFESCLGWYYTDWLEALYENPSISTYDLGKIIVDDMVSENEHNRFYGDRSILALIDESKIEKLWNVWTEFAYANEEALLSTNFSQDMEETGKGLGLSERFRERNGNKVFDFLMDEMIDYLEEYDLDEFYDSDEVYISDYCITDLMGLAHIIDSDMSEKLAIAADKALLYVSATSDNLSLTGISVTLPYNDRMLYNDLADVLEDCDFDEEYIEWLEKFCEIRNDRDTVDWGEWGREIWSEWGDR
ncbi:MAG: hypothetical protein J6I66_08150 [Lachnospiraceae bacterium]|nr:hypothetical protein [Lachnospiraceae bacterium]